MPRRRVPPAAASGCGELGRLFLSGEGPNPSYSNSLNRKADGAMRRMRVSLQINSGWRLGKSNPVDAEMAARAVLAEVAKDYPKSGLDGETGEG